MELKKIKTSNMCNDVHQSSIKNKLIKISLIILIVSAIVIIYKFNVTTYFSFATIKKYHIIWSGYVTSNYVLAVISFMLICMLITASSIPGIVLLIILGGFLFGKYAATIMVVISTTFGAMVPYFIARFLLGDYVTRKILHRIKFMESKLHQNQFFYIMSLRFIPLIPFWLANLAAGAFNVRSGTFFLATLIGMIPVTFIYTTIGERLNVIIKTGNNLNIGNFLDVKMLVALFVLAMLVLLPTIIRRNKIQNDKVL